MSQQHPGLYAPINGLQLYYELHGKGTPLVLLHGGGSTIQSTYGQVISLFAAHHQVIAVELQAHGHTSDRNTELTFEQDADDVAALLAYLKIEKAHIMGFSNGGTTALQFAIRHPERIIRLIAASALYRRDGMMPGFFDGFEGAELSHMPTLLVEAYLEANPNQSGLQAMFNRDVARMKGFKDIPDELIASIKAPTFVVNGATDVVLPEHAIRLSRAINGSELLIAPGGHGDYIAEIYYRNPENKLAAHIVPILLDFLEKE
ncbi:alpha/beta fold hydrolase [Chitinophaga sp. Hz27]|uniref:alpha/beta fold hydrolase n=1 Tax=Chitinophaga sp. Hz27 TaxID=3347169 RepID=UPI0035DF31D0